MLTVTNMRGALYLRLPVPAVRTRTGRGCSTGHSWTSAPLSRIQSAPMRAAMRRCSGDFWLCIINRAREKYENTLSPPIPRPPSKHTALHAVRFGQLHTLGEQTDAGTLVCKPLCQAVVEHNARLENGEGNGGLVFEKRANAKEHINCFFFFFVGSLSFSPLNSSSFSCCQTHFDNNIFYFIAIFPFPSRAFPGPSLGAERERERERGILSAELSSPSCSCPSVTQTTTSLLQS